MEIKFVSQILYFIEFAHRKKLPSSARMLWIGIFLCANKMAQKTGKQNIWPTEFFPASNAEITIMTGLDERTIRKDREILNMYRLIDYTKGDGKKFDPSYKINYLKRNGFKIVPDCVSDNTPDNVPDNTADNAEDNASDNPANGSKNAPDAAGDYPRKLNNDKPSRSPGSGIYSDASSRAAARSTGYSPSQGLVNLSSMPQKCNGLVPAATLERRKK